MDELEQRLATAGKAWRDAQPPAPNPGLIAVPRARAWAVPGRGLLAALGAVAVVLVAVALVGQLLRPATTGASPSPSVPGASPSPGLVYPDGLPNELAGQHVYRPTDPRVLGGGGQILVTGWVVGWAVSACIPQIGSPPPGCPEYMQLADDPHGPIVLMVMRWPLLQPEGGPGVVIRITPVDLGCSDTSVQSCVAPVVLGTDVVWQGPPTPRASS